jgi:RimJ/RimL family protein N-acetyltransferase
VTRANVHGQPVGHAVAAWEPAPHLDPLVLEGRWVRLEPLAADHAGDLGRTVCGSGTEPLWTYLYDDPPQHAAAYVAARMATQGLASLVMRPRGGEASGIASWLREDRTNGVVEVGGIILGRGLQRTTAATEAMWLMVRHAFAQGYRRYEWKCDALNAPSRAAAARLGFTYEGTFRQASVYKGRNRDTAWFSITDAEWAVLAPAYTAWLDPANFADGERGTGQRTSLSTLTARALTDAGTDIPHDGTRERLA